MSASAELYHYNEGDEDRILQALQEHGEDGVSAFALCSQLTLKFQPLNALLERLQRDGWARMVRRKNGATFWYPTDKKPEAPAAEASAPVASVTKDSSDSPEPSSAPPSELEQRETVDGSPERVPCPVDGCRSRILRKQKPAYAHLYNHHGLRGDELHARLDDVLGADRQRSGKVHSEDERRSCPIVGCPSEFRGHHSRSSLISHLVLRHDIEREEARGIADGKLAPPVMGMSEAQVPKNEPAAPINDPAIDACTIAAPQIEVECEDLPQRPLKLPAQVEGPTAAGTPPAPPSEEGLWMLDDICCNEAGEAVAEHLVDTLTEPVGNPRTTPLGDMCAMAREIEELARRRGCSCGVHLTCGDGITADGLFVSIKPGVSS